MEKRRKKSNRKAEFIHPVYYLFVQFPLQYSRRKWIVMNDVNYVLLGRRIRILRKYRKLTQEQLAEVVGLSIQHLSNAENARTKLGFPKIKRIADTLDVSLDELAGDGMKHRQIRPEIAALFRE